jgi:hypothetical protein
VSPNPARSTISIARFPIDPCGPVPPVDFKSATNNATIIVKIYDSQGNFRKATKVDAATNRIEISTQGLQPGLYYAQVSEAGKEDVKLKVWIEK